MGPNGGVWTAEELLHYYLPPLSYFLSIWHQCKTLASQISQKYCFQAVEEMTHQNFDYDWFGKKRRHEGTQDDSSWGMSFTFLHYEMIAKLLVFIIDSNLETLLSHQPETIAAHKS